MGRKKNAPVDKAPAPRKRRSGRASKTWGVAAQSQPLSKELVEMALRKHRGLMTYAAIELKVTRRSLIYWMDKFPELKAIREDGLEYVLDTAENGLLKAVEAELPWAICFVLKTKGRSRGYTEKSQLELSGNVGQNVVIQVVTGVPRDVIDVSALPAEQPVLPTAVDPYSELFKSIEL